MFKHVFKKQSVGVEVLDKPNLKGKTTNEIIEEIHESFYTEVDKLLAEAKIEKCLDTDKQDLIEKCARLKEQGFTNTKEVLEAQAEIERLNDLKAQNTTKQNLVEAINYFSFKYPQYKFITEESVKKICAKYNLVYGEVSKYIGTVPDKNLAHIENFKIDKSDSCYFKKVSFWGFRGYVTLSEKYLSFNEYDEIKNPKRSEFGLDIRIRGYHSYDHTEINFCQMEIAAPLKDFKMDGEEIKNFKISKIEIPDPVVLKPVFFKGMKHYLIVTAWGIEAEDSLVMNQNHN